MGDLKSGGDIACQQYVFWWPSLIVNRILDTRYWKYYLAHNFIAGGKYWFWKLPKLYTNISSLFTAQYVILSYLRILKNELPGALHYLCKHKIWIEIYLCVNPSQRYMQIVNIFFGQFWDSVLTSLLDTKFSLNLKF